MKIFILRKLTPLMKGTLKNATLEEKTETIAQLLPAVMTNLTFDQKMHLMREIMSLMMKNNSMNQMDEMMDTMMPMMMALMEEKGIDMFRMMEMMCPKCLSAVTSKATEEEKRKLKAQMTRVFSEL